LTDEELASFGQTRERLRVAWVTSERSEKPLLCLSTGFGPQLALKGRRRTGKTFVHFGSDVDKGPAASRLEEQDMKVSRNPTGDFDLDRPEIFGTELISTPPAVPDARVPNLQIEP
jgi:hypothetical protein